MRAYAVLAVVLLLPVAAAAQSSSADQIINQLQPRGGVLGGTRGIRPAAPSAATPAAPDAPAPAAPAPGRTAVARPRTVVPAETAAAAPAPSASLTVQFATASAQLTPQATHQLDELGRALSSAQLAGQRFRIEGHTDTMGGRDANQALSQRRADAVVEYLVGHYQVDAARLQAVGLGEQGLLVASGPDVAEPRNRRVVVVNLGS